MFKVGDKVVPIKKSVGCSLEDSIAWKNAQGIGQKFLYYNGINRSDSNAYMLGSILGSGGDFFLDGDFVPYKEVEKEDDEVFAYIYTIKELNNMVKFGILKETDEFIVRRA